MAAACVVEDLVLVAPWCKSCVPTALAALHARVASLPCAAGVLDNTLFPAAGGHTASAVGSTGDAGEGPRA